MDRTETNSIFAWMKTRARSCGRGLGVMAGAAATLGFAAACSTTTIQTGNGSMMHPEQRGFFDEDEPLRNRASDEETAFFNELSEQDEAYDEAAPARNQNVAARTDEDCPCEDKRPSIADATGAEDRRTTIDADSGDVDYNRPAVDPDAGAAEESVDAGDDPETNNGEYNQVGTASWYGRDFDGRPTASGEIYDSRKLTAAHKELPLGSIVLVRNMENNKEVLVTVNDRGPFVEGRILDVSEYGAELLGFKEQGLTTVGIRVVRRGGEEAEREGATKDFFAGGDTGRRPGGDLDLNPSRVKDESSLEFAYSVQVGLFQDLKNARNMERFLESYSQPVHVLRRGSTYVVKVGSFVKREEAEQMKFQLASDGYSGFVTGPEKDY